AALARGNGTTALPKVTALCGSSRCGVIRAANSPSNSPVRAISGVSSEAWNCAAMRPAMPKRLLSIGLLPGGLLRQYDAGIAGNHLARRQPGEELELVTKLTAGSHLCQARRVAVKPVDGGQLLAPQHRTRWHGKHLAAAGDQFDAGKHAGVNAVDTGVQLGANAEAVAAGFRVREHGDLVAGQARAVIQHHRQAALPAHGIDIALRYRGGDTNAVHRQ